MQSGSSITSRGDWQVGLAGRSGDGGDAQQESARLQSARAFDSESDRDWCELIRDVAAIANSGGGTLFLRATGERPLADSARSATSELVASDILQRLARFTDASFADVAMETVRRPDGSLVAITIGRAPFPIVFTKAASYLGPADSTKRVEVFAAGSVYFWNGQTSEPATGGSLQSFVERLLRRVRRRWLAGIRRVVNQPVASLVGAAEARRGKRGVAAGQANLQPVRIVTDPQAPALQPQDVDRLYPLRQKELVAELNRRLGRRALNSYDIQAARRHHRLDERPDFVFHLPGAGRRYSPAALEWIMERYERDPEFFRHARSADQEMLKLRRRKPR